MAASARNFFAKFGISGRVASETVPNCEVPGSMNSSAKMDSEEVLRVELEVLRREHRDLDDAISALQESQRADQLRLRRLKKTKLDLKDRIARLEDKLTPDIIA